uniref:Zinc transport protein ZntB n=1 Tax=Talaromyces marneffei PM1 TaxID=1077442 RepID=A0A093VB30_TALMA
MLQSIIDAHNISVQNAETLWDLTSVFYTRNLKTEMVFCLPFSQTEDGDFVDVAYTIRYPEYKPLEDEWTMRQSGVYHRFNRKTKQSLYIVFNPMPKSKLHQSLLLHLQSDDSKSSFWLHQTLFTTYVPAWRHYIASLERRFLPIANTASASYINEELRVGHGHLSTLISIQKDFLQIPTILDAAGDVLTELNTAVALDVNQETQKLKNIKRQCETYSRTATHLRQRVQMTAQLLADTLLFRDQVLANEQNGNMLQLNRSAVFLTTLTLLYLPASFLTSFFGMNFFAMNQQDDTIIGTPMIWIFVPRGILPHNGA